MTPNVARTIGCKAWNSPAEYQSWVARCDIKGSNGTMLHPIFWKKVQGQKHSGRWGIVEHQIPSLIIRLFHLLNWNSHALSWNVYNETILWVIQAKVFINIFTSLYVLWFPDQVISFQTNMTKAWNCLEIYIFYLRKTILVLSFATAMKTFSWLKHLNLWKSLYICLMAFIVEFLDEVDELI